MAAYLLYAPRTPMTDFTAQFRRATDVRKAQRYLSRRSIIAKIDGTALHILVPKRIGGARLAQQMMQAGFVFLVRIAPSPTVIDHSPMLQLPIYSDDV